MGPVLCVFWVLGFGFFFFFLIWAFVPMGFWWAVASGGVVVVTRQWRRGARGRGKVHTRVEEKIRKKKKGKNIFYCVDILFS